MLNNKLAPARVLTLVLDMRESAREWNYACRTASKTSWYYKLQF